MPHAPRSSALRRGGNPNRRQLLAGAAGLATAAALTPFGARAQQSYLSGQTLEVLSGYSEGSSGAVVMQEWARAVERVLPDTRVVYRPNPGGSTELAYALLADAAPEGLTVGSHSLNSLIGQTESERKLDITQFAILGAVTRTVDILLASTDSGIASMDDLRARAEPAVLPVRATVSGDYFQGLFLNALFGTRIKPVTGYSSAERGLAFRSGEAQLLSKQFIDAIPFVEEGSGVAILKFGDGPVPEALGDPPAMSALEHDPALDWVVAYYNALTATRIVATQRQVPTDRLAVLREVFMQAVNDPGFIEAAGPFTTIDPSPGDELQAELDALLSQAGDLEARAREALACGLQRAETGAKCGA